MQPSYGKSNHVIIVVVTKMFGLGLKNLRILFLKLSFSEFFWRLESSLFYSMIVEGQKEFLKKLHLISKHISSFMICYGLFENYIHETFIVNC